MKIYWKLTKNTAQYVMIGPLLNKTDLSVNTTAWASLTGEVIKATTTDGGSAPADLTLTNAPVVSADGVQRHIQLTQAETNHDGLSILLTADEVEPQLIMVRFE
jgi:hypothetical protein